MSAERPMSQVSVVGPNQPLRTQQGSSPASTMPEIQLERHYAAHDARKAASTRPSQSIVIMAVITRNSSGLQYRPIMEDSQLGIDITEEYTRYYGNNVD